MALSTPPLTIEAAQAVLRRRGESQRVVIRLDDALAGPLEGIAFADEVAATVQRLDMAIANRSWNAVFREMQRLGNRTVRFRDECRRLAGTIEGPDAA